MLCGILFEGSLTTYVEVNASAFVTVKKTKELIHKNSGNAGREKKTVEILQLLLA